MGSGAALLLGVEHAGGWQDADHGHQLKVLHGTLKPFRKLLKIR